MKINIRTLEHTTFTIDVESEEQIKSIKEKIADLSPTKVPVERQKLIYAGRILSNEETVASYGISEGEMVVLMIIRANTAPAKPAEKNAVQNDKEKAPVTVENTTTSSIVPPTVSSTMPNVAPAAPLEIPDSLIASVMEVGFTREDTVKALRAAYGNPDRAIEYLLSGAIPEVEDGHSLAASGLEEDSELFQALRNTPNFAESIAMLQQNPELLSAVLAQVGQRNPALLQAIQANPQAFLQLLQGLSGGAHDGGEHDQEDYVSDDEHELTAEDAQAMADTSSAATHNIVHVTQEEYAAIGRLCDLGFDKAKATEAYFVCDKNEEVAAEYLFEHMNDQ